MTELIHVATLQREKRLFLRKESPTAFRWYQGEEPTEVVGHNVDEAIRLGRRKWALDGFTLVNCGYRFTLPERDEHGSPATYQQMVKSQNSMNGVYFDEDLGHVCIVRDIPSETRKLTFK